MGLESATYVSDFVITNPAGGDARNQGDNHLRLMKAVLQSTFPTADRTFRFPRSVAAKTGSYTVVFPDDMNKAIPVDCSSGNITITLPDVSAQALGDGFELTILKSDQSSNYVTVSGTLNAWGSSKRIRRPYQRMRLTWVSNLSVWVADLSSALEVGALFPYSGTTSPDTTELIMCDGVTTLGDASSSATIAAAYTRQGFEHLWNSYSNTVCPVSSGRGATAAADYAAHKRITMPDLRGRAFVGLDTMNGQSDAGLLGSVFATGTTNGEAAGTETFQLLTTHMPSHAHTGPSHTHTFSANTGNANQGHTHSGSTNAENQDHSHAIGISVGTADLGAATNVMIPGGSTSSGGANVTHAHAFTTGDQSTTHAHAVSGTTDAAGTGATSSVGSDTAHSNVQPSFLGSWMMAI